MSLRKSKTIDFMGRKVIVWELTVPQVDDFLKKMREAGEEMKAYLREFRTNPNAQEPKAVPPHTLDALMDSSMPFELVRQCVPDLTEAELCGGEVSPSDLEPLYKAIEEVNPFFMQMAVKVVEAGPAAKAAAGRAT